MLRPTPGELLEGVRRELADQVLPEVPPGAATRQLRAALHTLGRLQRTWDLLPAYLEADNADLRATLPVVAARAGLTWTEGPAPDTELPGVHDPGLQQLMRANAGLHSDLHALQDTWRQGPDRDPGVADLLLDLHTRMATRARLAGGVPDDDD